MQNTTRLNSKTPKIVAKRNKKKVTPTHLNDINPKIKTITFEGKECEKEGNILCHTVIEYNTIWFDIVAIWC